MEMKLFIKCIFLSILCLISTCLNADILYKNSDQMDTDFTFISVQELQAKACTGDVKYKYLLALHKTREEQQKEEGVRMLEELSSLGVLDATHALYAISKWVNVDSLTPQKALAYLKQGAEGGYDLSQLELARAYIKGAFGKKDPEQAHYWLVKAAEQNNAEALTYVSTDYYAGRGVARDDAKGFEWLILAYNKLGKEFNNWYRLGQAYEKGAGTSVDLIRAYMCYDLLGSAGIVEKARIAPRMTTVQRAEGLRLSQEWQQKSHVYTMQSLGLKRQKDGSYQ